MRQRILALISVSLLLTACRPSAAPATDPPSTSQQTSEHTNPIQPTEPLASIPIASATPYASAMPLPTPADQIVEIYVVQWGDTLSGISLAFDVSVDELAALNGLNPETAAIGAGQTLRIPLHVTRSGPAAALLPDSELVYSPAYLDFDVATTIAQHGGVLSSFGETVNGRWMSGTEIVTTVARQYSVGPRVLLALLEHYGGWVTQAQPFSYRPLGPANPYYEESFFLQLSWAANRINEGYYGYKQHGQIAVSFDGGGRALVPPNLNAGTAGVYNILAVNSAWETWQNEALAFSETYRRLFGDPFARSFEPLVPADLTQPSLRLPWEAGQTFYYTGGPHAAYGSRSAWAAVDFAPPDIQGSCYYSAKNVVAAADGKLVLGEIGETYLDLDGDGNLQTGWVVLYLHVVARDDVTSGQQVAVGAPIGYASCEGGVSNSSHVHLARRYNGEWMAADGPVPLVLSGWQFRAGVGQYDGTATRAGATKTACECWDETLNALVGE